MTPTTFIKVGTHLINPAQISCVELEYRDEENPEHPPGVEIDLANEVFLTFWGKEAEILRKFFLSGSRTYDLEDLYGEPIEPEKITQ